MCRLPLEQCVPRSNSIGTVHRCEDQAVVLVLQGWDHLSEDFLHAVTLVHLLQFQGEWGIKRRGNSMLPVGIHHLLEDTIQAIIEVQVHYRVAFQQQEIKD